MEQILNIARDQAIVWIARWGDWAVVPALLLDPGGVPWPWIFVMLLAEQAGKNPVVLCAMGLCVLALFDHAMYWLGAIAGRPLLFKARHRFPAICKSIHEAETWLRERGGWALVIGRFLPVMGRWIGLAAGLAHVPYGRFAFLQLAGASITVVGFGVLAHFVGEKTFHEPWFPAALFWAFVGGTAFTILGGVWAWWQKRRNKLKDTSLNGAA
jgi:membrane protein DedA with SNARE-associated domain